MFLLSYSLNINCFSRITTISWPSQGLVKAARANWRLQNLSPPNLWKDGRCVRDHTSRISTLLDSMEAPMRHLNTRKGDRLFSQVSANYYLRAWYQRCSLLEIGFMNHYKFISMLYALIIHWNFLLPSGFVFTRGGYVEMSKRLSLPLGSTLDWYCKLLYFVSVWTYLSIVTRSLDVYTA